MAAARSPSGDRAPIDRRGAMMMPLLLALAAGALAPLAFAPFSFWPLAFAAPALLFRLWWDAPPRRAAALGFAFGVGQFAVGVSWVYVAIHEFGDTGVVPSALLTGAFVAVLALYPAAVGYAGRRMAPSPGAGRALLLLWPALWLLGEWLRGWIISGFPWLSLGYSQIDAPLAGLGPLFGVYGIGLAVAFGAGVAAWLSVPGRQPLWRRALPVAGLVVLFVAGGALRQVGWSEPAGAPLRVASVQGNLPQETKWDPEQIARRLELYAGLSRERFGSVDLVVWPENAVTIFYHQLQEYFAELEADARRAGTDLVLGLPVLAEDGRRYYTGMMSVGAAERAFYFKHHLVPFGEYVPLEGLLRGLIGFFDLPMSSFLPGPTLQPPLPAAGHQVAVSVCYEDAFGSEFAAALADATLLVNGSNNAWYGDSLAPHQHLQISRMRALETGRPMIRATTNGISALIDARGRVTARSPQFTTYVLEGSVQPTTGTTPFTRWKNVPVLVFSLLLAGIALRRRS